MAVNWGTLRFEAPALDGRRKPNPPLLSQNNRNVTLNFPSLFQVRVIAQSRFQEVGGGGGLTRTKIRGVIRVNPQ